MHLNMPSYSRWIMVLLKHPELLMTVASSAPHLASEKTFDARWTQGLRPIGDAIAPVVDELFPPDNVSSASANVPVEELEDQLLKHYESMSFTLDEAGKKKPDRPFLRKIGNLMLDQVLPALLPLLLKGIGGMK